MCIRDRTADAVVVAEQTRMGLWQLFMSGGWLMWVLLILGGLTIFIFVERFMAIRKASEFDMNFMNRIRDYILDGKVAAAVDLFRKTNTPIARMIEKGIGRIGRPMSDVQSAIENVANLEVSKLETNLPILATIAGGAPMIGFLGTVVGMVQTFMDLAAAGEGNAGDLSGAPEGSHDGTGQSDSGIAYDLSGRSVVGKLPKPSYPLSLIHI